MDTKHHSDNTVVTHNDTHNHNDTQPQCQTDAHALSNIVPQTHNILDTMIVLHTQSHYTQHCPGTHNNSDVHSHLPLDTQQGTMTHTITVIQQTRHTTPQRIHQCTHQITLTQGYNDTALSLTFLLTHIIPTHNVIPTSHKHTTMDTHHLMYNPKITQPQSHGHTPPHPCTPVHCTKQHIDTNNTQTHHHTHTQHTRTSQDSTLTHSHSHRHPMGQT